MSNTVIALKKSATPSATPVSLANGELAINFADGKLFYKHANGTILSIEGGGGGGSGDSFGTVNAAGTLIVADTAGDILTLEAGSGITITGDAVNDKITISGLNIYNQANTALTTGQAAFGKANTSGTDAVNAFGQANTAGTDAVNAFGQANTSRLHANASFLQANTARDHANAAFAQANTSGGAAYFSGNNGDVGAASGLGDIFRVHTNTLTANVTIYSGNNALAAGPITIEIGKVLTIQNDARVVIV